MAEGSKDITKEVWKHFLQKHWKVTLIIAAGIIGAAIGAIAVFLWRATGPVAAGRYPVTLDLWTIGFIVSLVLDLILWEFLIVVLPVIAAGIAVYFIWWNKFPAEEKQEYANASKQQVPRKKARDGGGVFGFLVTMTWLIIIGADGMWDTAFWIWTFSYLVTSVLTACLWDLAIIGIPAATALILWIRREMKK